MQISRNQEEGRWEFLPSWRSADVPDLKELLSKMLNDLTWNLRGSRKPSGLSVHLFLKCRRLPANDQTGSHFEEQLVRLLFSASADGCILTPTDVPALVSSAAGLIKSDLRRQKANQIAKEEVSEGRSVRPAGSRGGSDGKKMAFHRRRVRVPGELIWFLCLNVVICENPASAAAFRLRPQTSVTASLAWSLHDGFEGTHEVWW